MRIGQSDARNLAQTLSFTKDAGVLQNLSPQERKVCYKAIETLIESKIPVKITDKQTQKIIEEIRPKFLNAKPGPVKKNSLDKNAPVILGKLLKPLLKILDTFSLNVLGFVSAKNLEKKLKEYQELNAKEREELIAIPTRKKIIQEEINNLKTAINVVTEDALSVAMEVSKDLDSIVQEKYPMHELRKLKEKLEVEVVIANVGGKKDRESTLLDHLKVVEEVFDLYGNNSFPRELKALADHHRKLVEGYNQALELNKNESLPRLQNELNELRAREMELKEKFSNPASKTKAGA